MNENTAITTIYNHFIKSLSNEDEINFCKQNFMLFIQSGEATRNADNEVKKIILNQKSQIFSSFFLPYRMQKTCEKKYRIFKKNGNFRELQAKK